MNEILYIFLSALIPILVGYIVNRITTWLMNKKIISAENATEMANKAKEFVEDNLDQVLSFFDKEKPMSDTKLDTIVNVIPANTYQMSTESLERVLSTCASEEERARINDLITEYETPLEYGQECCVYTLDTTYATFEVQWGVPEMIVDKTKGYKKLTQEQLNAICDIVGKDNEFLALTNIIDNERNLINDYTLEYGPIKIHVHDGVFTAGK